MLFTIERVKVDYIPHKRDYDRWRQSLSETDYVNIMESFEQILNNGEVHVSSFVPGNDWTNTPYQAIYIACDEDEQHSAFFFGLLMWEAVMRHNDNWSFIKYDDKNIKGMTYFKVKID